MVWTKRDSRKAGRDDLDEGKANFSSPESPCYSVAFRMVAFERLSFRFVDVSVSNITRSTQDR